MDKLLKLLKTNARISNRELAVILGKSEDEITEEIKAYEEKGIIKGYSAIISDSAQTNDYIKAYIELKITPKAQSGYEEMAKQIAQYEEVESVSLMSGSYDLAVTVVGTDIRDISAFVAHRLAPIDGVISTATHFFLQNYKENGILLCDENTDERGLISL